MVGLWDTTAQYPLLESIQGGTIHQWLWKAVPYPYAVWDEGIPRGWSSGIWDKESCYVTSSYGWCSMGPWSNRPTAKSSRQYRPHFKISPYKIAPTLIKTLLLLLPLLLFLTMTFTPPRGCARGRIGTRFLRPRGTSPLKGVNPAGTPGYRNGTESFCLNERSSVVRDV
jgi:hypothetical protein